MDDLSPIIKDGLSIFDGKVFYPAVLDALHFSNKALTGFR